MAKTCPECNSTKFVKCGWSVVNRTKVQRYRCEKCLRTFIHPKWSGSRGKDASKQPVEGSTIVEDDEEVN